MGWVLEDNKELCHFLQVIWYCGYMGIRSDSEKMHGDVFRHEMPS